MSRDPYIWFSSVGPDGGRRPSSHRSAFPDSASRVDLKQRLAELAVASVVDGSRGDKCNRLQKDLRDALDAISDTRKAHDRAMLATYEL